MPSAPPPPSPGRTLTIPFESGRRLAPDALRINPAGATLEVDGFFHTPLKLTLGQLHLAMIDRGPAKVKGQAGRFPILKRVSATVVVPREQGIEGWLWTSTGGSALTILGDEAAAPTGALLFTKPLTAEQLKPAMQPDAYEALADRSPLGSPSILGVLFRAAEPANAETAFRSYGLLRPLTDREVPPTMRRSLPTDRPADPNVGGAPAARTTSKAPPGF
jgi:hypothetical protein